MRHWNTGPRAGEPLDSARAWLCWFFSRRVIPERLMRRKKLVRPRPPFSAGSPASGRAGFLSHGKDGTGPGATALPADTSPDLRPLRSSLPQPCPPPCGTPGGGQSGSG